MSSASVVPTPTPPSNWNLSTIVAYVGAFVLFLLASLTQAGVIVPAHVSTEVQLIVGIVGQVAGALTALVATVNHHATVRALASYEH